MKVWVGSEKGDLFETDSYFDGEFGESIKNIEDSKKVIELKSKTAEGLKDLPSVPK